MLFQISSNLWVLLNNLHLCVWSILVSWRLPCKPRLFCWYLIKLGLIVCQSLLRYKLIHHRVMISHDNLCGSLLLPVLLIMLSLHQCHCRRIVEAWGHWEVLIACLCQYTLASSAIWLTSVITVCPLLFNNFSDTFWRMLDCVLLRGSFWILLMMKRFHNFLIINSWCLNDLGIQHLSMRWVFNMSHLLLLHWSNLDLSTIHSWTVSCPISMLTTTTWRRLRKTCWFGVWLSPLMLHSLIYN